MSASQQQGWHMPVPAFKAVVFIPSKEEAIIRSLRVELLSAVAHDIITSPDGKGGNHWCFYLSVGPNQSVRIDPTPSGIPGPSISGGSKANIVVSCLPSAYSTRAQQVDTIAVALDVTVGRFLDAIMDAGREKYEFDVNGRGCRAWTSDQIDLFVSLGLITSSSEAEKAKSDLLLDFADYQPTGKRLALSRGAYY
ncbi:hypothetical protein QBC46DRAFT_423006 [Diplogelasinospora grovesii]|uniref:DUF7770 domain-containing protein n=1 Tax=Diplogelasinospora grovesii TaxID=303347 RepID=A0AAN6NFU8_9PEZI|nr:hypothetical protein QBC46DRAFT_423006 [Diplogelasinospora grovesii]